MTRDPDVHCAWRWLDPLVDVSVEAHYSGEVSRQLRLWAVVVIYTDGDARFTCFIKTCGAGGEGYCYGPTVALRVSTAWAFLAADPTRILQARAALVRQTLDAQVRHASLEEYT